MPRQKHTSVAIVAAEAEKVKLLLRLEELDRQNKLAVAELELIEEVQDAEEEQIVIWHLRDLPDSKSNKSPAKPRDNALEKFPVDEDDPLGSQDGRDEPLGLEDQCSELKTMPVS